MNAQNVLVADTSTKWLGKPKYFESSVQLKNFTLQFSYNQVVDLPSIINLRAIHSCTFPSTNSENQIVIVLSLGSRTIEVVCNCANRSAIQLVEAIKLYLSYSPSEDVQQYDPDVISILVDYYLMLNNIEVEDLGIKPEEFTLEKKKKFISNSNSQFMEGTKIIKELFLVLKNDPCDSKIYQYPQIISDYPIATTLFIQEDGISFLCHCILSILQQKVTDHIESVLMNYLCIFNEMLLMDEAQSILVSSSFYFSALIQLLHIPTISIINATILLFNRICENNPVTADIIAQCFIEEMNITSMNNSELSLSILICLLNEPIDVTIKMNVVKFLAVLIYSAKSLASRIKIIGIYNNYGFNDICNRMEKEYESENLSSILAITRDVIKLTITEDDFDTMTSEDIPSIAQIIYNHCTDETTQSLYMMLLRNIVSLPSEGTYGHDLWSSLVEMSDNLVSVSRQWDDRKHLGLSMLKRKKTEKALTEELEKVNGEYEELKKRFDELEFLYNKNCCLEQELDKRIKQKTLEVEVLQKKIQSLVKENDVLKKQPSRGNVPPRPGSPSPLRAPPPPPKKPSIKDESVATSLSVDKSVSTGTCPHKYAKIVDYKYYKQFNLMLKGIRTKEQLQMRMPMEGMDPAVLDLDMNTVGFSDIPEGEEVKYPDGHVEPCCKPGAAPAPTTCQHKYAKIVDYKYYKQFNLMLKGIRTKEQLQMRMPMEGMDPAVLDLDMNTVGFSDIPEGEEVKYPDGHVEPCCKLGVIPAAPGPSVPALPPPLHPPPSILVPPPPIHKTEPEMDPYTPPSRNKQTPSIPLRQVYWSTVSGRSLKDTVWEKMKELNRFDKKELEEIFSIKQQTISTAGPSVSTSSEEEVVSFVDAKKETNIGIGVRKLRYSGDEVKQFLYKVDKFSLSAEALNVMIGILPKEDECLTIRSYQGDTNKLTFVNAFLYSVSEIPNCLDRANCLILRMNFAEEKEKYRTDLQNFQDDCHLIQNNTHFLSLLGYILDLGNYLNGTSARGGACGFHLDILPQLERTKSCDNTTTLIDYMVKCLVTNAPDTLQVITELDVLSRRTELSLEDINKSIMTLSSNLKNVHHQVMKPPINEQDKFAEQMRSFYTTADEELKQLQAFFKETSDCYTQTCEAFGENPKTLKSTELFSYIVSFISSLKTSHKHLLDLQAEEKLKKVAQDWQNIALSNTINRHQSTSQENSKLAAQPPPFRLPALPAKNQSAQNEKRPPPIPTTIVQQNSTEQNGKNEKKRSLWTRLLKWGN